MQPESGESTSRAGSDLSGMAETRLVVLWLFCAGVLLCSAAPPRWQGTEATVTDAWADDFDLDGDKEWLGEVAISPSSIPPQSDYEDYDDDEEEENRQQPSMDEERQEPNQAEFLFVPSRDNRLLLQDDDDDQSGPIKVRHTGKNPYPEVIDNSDDDSNDSSRQFEFTIDNGDEDDDDKDNEVDDNTNDFVLDDAPRKDDSVSVLPQQEVRDDDEDDDDDDDDTDDDNFVSDGDSNSDQMFETPEEDSQVIYGDHVFLY